MPIIGINANFTGDLADAPMMTVRANYVDAVTSAGGLPFILPNVEDPNLIRKQVAACDGFILTGGPDIDPEKYGEQPNPTINPLPKRRENYDFQLIQEILKSRKPFLAICLGCQEVNVALGGGLIQDIASQTSSTIRHSWKQAPYLHRHEVQLTTGSRIAELLAVSSLSTNSAHHQAIAGTGKGIAVCGRTEDGIIECYELENYPFGFGIQWHPEYLTREAVHMKLFQGLVSAASHPEPAENDLHKERAVEAGSAAR